MNLNGPIPGENYTSDTKNYAWHRPPEYADLDKAIEASAKKLLSEEGSPGIVTMLKMGMDIATLTDMFVTSGIGAGKWTPDFALLLAGPVSHIIYLMAEGYGIKPDLGIERPKPKYTAAYVKEIKTNKKKVEDVKTAIGDMANEMAQTVEQQVGQQPPATGFMGIAQQAQQELSQPTGNGGMI